MSRSDGAPSIQQSGQPSVLVAHTRVVGALLVREMSTRFGTKPGGYIWAIFEPVAQIVLLTLIFTAIVRVPPLGTSFMLFYATGFLPFQFYVAISTYVAKAVKSNRALLSYPTVAPIDTVVARTILQILTTMLVSIIVLSITMVIFVRYIQAPAWLFVLEAIAASCLLGLGVALANVVLVLRYPLYDELFGILSRPLFLISGIFYLPDNIPHPFREYLLYNPLVHVVILFRKGFYPEYRGYGLDVVYLWSSGLTCFAIGLVIFTMLRRTFRQED